MLNYYVVRLGDLTHHSEDETRRMGRPSEMDWINGRVKHEERYVPLIDTLDGMCVYLFNSCVVFLVFSTYLSRAGGNVLHVPATE